ncbi:Angiopoietin-related protein 7 [Holothuria leucospilota]|uniref:Angiopoietin-related protein 7 n=1 Tax=Holothuria leucospilota TaxID=206669 RepID=A0A9Q1H2P6_HOLLE|nr:Angiopoietin-related protein 7 [Holothuria leucospilota]
MSKGILNCTGSKVIKCEDDIGHCSKNIDGTVLICGCNSTDTSNFIPMGFTHVNGTRRCYCNEQGTTECVKNDHMNDSSMCNSEVEIANWTCQIDNDGYQTNLTKLPRDCNDLYEDGVRDNGIYCVYPDYLRNSSEPHRKVYCYMGTEGETESWTCQIGNHGYQNGLSKEPRSKPSDCHDLYKDGVRDNGIYCVYPDYLSNSTEPRLKVYCDMTVWPQAGWTVIQRRVNGSVGFNRSWNDYKDGFGEINHEFWLGNENIYNLMYRNNMQLRIDIYKNKEQFCHVIYNSFRIGNETTGYKLLELGNRQGDDGNGFFVFRLRARRIQLRFIKTLWVFCKENEYQPFR